MIWAFTYDNTELLTNKWPTSAHFKCNVYFHRCQHRHRFYSFLTVPTDHSSCNSDAICVVMMILNNAAAPPFSFHIHHCAYRPRLVECFQLFMIQSCAKCVFPCCFSPRGFQRGKATHAVIHVPTFRWTITLISDRPFWCAEGQNKINSERKAVKDLQRSALINEGLYQLGAHDWCVNISAVTQFGTGRRVTPLFTEHKDHKQALATNTLPSVNSWAFQRIYGFSKDLSTVNCFVLWLRNFVFRPITRLRPFSVGASC